MVRLKFLLICPVFLAAAACASLLAQTQTSQPQPDKSPVHVKIFPPTLDDETPGKNPKFLPAPTSLPSTVPFAVDNPRSDFPRRLQFLPADQMTEHDRDLAANAESSIRERAGFENLEFNEGQWAYRQIACPALPNHLLLRFTRDDGTRAMSMFSAAIPRNGEGRVRIIPIVRKGYSLFSPAPIGPLTLAAFNHIRAEDNPDGVPDWVTTGVCYAALAGANPEADQAKLRGGDGPPLPVTDTPTLLITKYGGAIIRFDDLSAAPRPMQWNMFFDRKGKLLKATHAPVYPIRYHERPVRTLDIDEVTPSR